MKAIILAAGASKRLRPLTDDIPKCLIQIGEKPILEYQLDAVDSGTCGHFIQEYQQYYLY